MSQKLRKTSPNSSKQGPMKATLPMSSLLRQGSNIKKSKSNSPNSPTSSWKARISPDTPSTGQRSPGSLSHKAKFKTSSQAKSASIRRTASLDTLYLRGQWPTETLYMYCGHLLVDKATQTEDPRVKQQDYTEDKLDRYIRQRLQRSTKDNGASNRERTPVLGLILNQPSPMETSQPKAVPVGPKQGVPRPMRNSVEGLNQEIERLVLSEQDHGEIQFGTRQTTPEGHRAPLADILRSTRSVNTQTPAGGGGDFGSSSTSSGPPSRESFSPLVAGAMDTSRPPSDLQGSRSSTPDQEASKFGTSPHINRFLAREPPDGCEKVNLKFVEDTRRPAVDLTKLEFCPRKPCLNLKPSLGSAFYPLHREGSREVAANGLPYVSHGDDVGI